LDFLVLYKKEKGYHRLGQNAHHKVPGAWDEEDHNNHELECVAKTMKQLYGPSSRKEGKCTPIPNAQVPNSSQHLNRILVIRKRNMWTYQAFEEAMDVVENRTCSLSASRSWSICLSFLSGQINDKTKSRKMGPKGVFT
jgi:hypothetical protein